MTAPAISIVPLVDDEARIFRLRHPGDEHEARRLSGSVIGIAGAVGAFGGVLVNLAFRQSFLTYRTADAAYLAFIAFYALRVLVTWIVYLRRHTAV